MQKLFDVHNRKGLTNTSRISQKRRGNTNFRTQIQNQNRDFKASLFKKTAALYLLTGNKFFYILLIGSFKT